MNLRNLRMLALLSASILLPSSPAFSQPPQVQHPTFADGRNNRPPALRVQTQVNVFQTGSVSGNIQEQDSMSEKARRAIYQIAARECQILTEVFNASCKLVSVNAASNVDARMQGQGNEGIRASATAVYELTDRPN